MTIYIYMTIEQTSSHINLIYLIVLDGNSISNTSIPTKSSLFIELVIDLLG